MKDYFVKNNYADVKRFERLRDAREYADAIGGYNPGWLITSLDYSTDLTRFIASKNFEWFLTNSDIKVQARAALHREKARLRQAILADIDHLTMRLEYVNTDIPEVFLSSIFVYALGSDVYRELKKSYFCNDSAMAALCNDAIAGTKIEKIVYEKVNKKRAMQAQEKARLETLMSIG